LETPTTTTHNLIEIIAATLELKTDKFLLKEIVKGYSADKWCVKLSDNLASFKGARQDPETKLLFLKDRLIIPRKGTIKQILFQLVHNTLGHFGFNKYYKVLRKSYFWPQIQRDLNSLYIPSCL